jgi:leucyl/phenylalanyl-tRNA--protein transferase
VTIPWLDRDDPFPPAATALTDPNGLIAAGGDLSPQRLMDAYAHGIFPWFNEGDPILWWTPDPRMVLFTGELHVSRSLRRIVRSELFSVTADEAFGAVMEGCAGPRPDHDGTWITDEMREAYERLAAMGVAHSIEVWRGTDLVGGLYGVAIGRMFFGESMFSRVSNASKVALVYLVRQLERWRFELIDCQMSTSHLASLGAREVPRADFLAHVERLTREPAVPGPWRIDPGLLQ